MSAAPIGLLVMAYGTASGPDGIERYYTDIRGGRSPTPDHVHELKERYAAIGNVFPLLDTTRAQADGTVRELNGNADGRRFRAYLGMKHSPPFIPQGVARMREDGIERAVGIVMAPHWSGMSVETYLDRVDRAAAEGGPSFTFVRGWHDHPGFIELLAGRVDAALAALERGDREAAAVIFSAHSLPIRMLDDGSERCLRCDCEPSCRYRDGLRATADLVAGRLGLGPDRVAIAWQSAGRTEDPWWGPALEEVIVDVAKDGRPAVVVCSAGFVADHLEVLYDLDIQARRIAEDAGIRFARTEMPNADPAFCKVLASVIRDHLAAS